MARAYTGISWFGGLKMKPEKLNKFIAQMKIEHCFNEAEND